MSEPPTTPPASLPARALAEQRERWARGDRVAVEALIAAYPDLHSDADAVLDLIYQEVFLRERQGQAPSREEYLHRFPHLADAIRAQFEVHQAIQSDGAAEAEPPEVPGYTLLAEIGQGGMGRVYKARDTRHGGLVAVKLLRAEHFRKEGVRQRFVAEARASAVLDHSNIIKVLEIGDCDGGPFLVMELIDGTSLQEVIRRGPPEPARAAAWLMAVAEAVHYAHSRGVIHRDLKPANIMIDAAGRPRVMDFGMAKILRRAGVTGHISTQEGTILGTPSYMPPEQTGDIGVGPGPYSDVYSLGAVLYALLTGRPPFDGGNLVATLLQVRSPQPPPTVRSLRPEVPEMLERICHTCLQKSTADRYATAAELAGELRRFLHGAGAPTAALTLCSVTTGEMLPVAKEYTLVGRSAECDLVLKAPDVSRRHCRIVCRPNGVFIEDLGSSQGTRVNGVRVTRAELQDGDRLELAGQAFQVLMRDARKE
jgi:serine/threonine protein kinase